MPSDSKVLRIKTGVIVVYASVYVVGLVLLSIHMPFGISDRHRLWFVPAYAIVGAFGAVDLVTRRIVLGADSIRIVSYSDYLCRSIPRTLIKGVTWEKGCGASLILHEGRGVRLPNVGRDPQGLTNTIRAWLRKTEL